MSSERWDWRQVPRRPTWIWDFVCLISSWELMEDARSSETPWAFPFGSMAAGPMAFLVISQVGPYPSHWSLSGYIDSCWCRFPMYQVTSSFWSYWPLTMLARNPAWPMQLWPFTIPLASTDTTTSDSSDFFSPHSQKNILSHLYYFGLGGKTRWENLENSDPHEGPWPGSFQLRSLSNTKCSALKSYTFESR